MGRRGVPLADPERWVFNRLAEAYRARPPYPEALVDRLAELAGGRAARVADLGAGTGDLALPLARRGLAVSAVEPAAAMLAVLEERRGRGLEIAPVHAAAEATGLPEASHDLVLLADAAHWVDPERAGREVARIVAAGGVVAVVEARFAPTPFMDGLAALLARANPKARPRPPGAVRQLLAIALRGACRPAAGAFGAQRSLPLAAVRCPPNPPTRVRASRAPPGARAAIAEERFAQDAPLGAGGLSALVRSLSYAGPALGPRALDDLVAEAGRLAASCGGARLSRALTLSWGRSRRRRSRSA